MLIGNEKLNTEIVKNVLVDSNLKGFKFLGLIEDIRQTLNKPVDVMDVKHINKTKDRTIEDLYSDENFAEASCFVLGLIGEQIPGIKTNSNGSNIKDDDYDEFYQKLGSSIYSTVTDFAKFLGLSTSRPLATLV